MTDTPTPDPLDFFCTPRGHLTDWCSVHGDIPGDKSIAAHIRTAHDLTYDGYRTLEILQAHRRGITEDELGDEQRRIGIAAARPAPDSDPLTFGETLRESLYETLLNFGYDIPYDRATKITEAVLARPAALDDEGWYSTRRPSPGGTPMTTPDRMTPEDAWDALRRDIQSLVDTPYQYGDEIVERHRPLIEAAALAAQPKPPEHPVMALVDKAKRWRDRGTITETEYGMVCALVFVEDISEEPQ